MTRAKMRNYLCLISQVEPKTTDETCEDESWIKALQEELDQNEMNNTW